MGIDIRLPIGGMFAIVGVLLTIYGAVQPASSTSVGVNIDLIWGVVLLGFAALMIALGYRGMRSARER